MCEQNGCITIVEDPLCNCGCNCAGNCDCGCQEEEIEDTDDQ